MPLFFITGVSGSGKSAVTLSLRARGYETFDTDDDALARWQNVETGYLHPKSSVKSEQRTEEFLNQHRWNVPREFIKELALKAENKPVFVCGVANNIIELRDLFSGVFALVIDEKTLRHRLTARTNNDWGKQPQELQQTLTAQKDASEAYDKSDFIIIDACQSKEAVVDIILKAAGV